MTDARWKIWMLLQVEEMKADALKGQKKACDTSAALKLIHRDLHGGISA